MPFHLALIPLYIIIRTQYTFCYVVYFVSSGITNKVIDHINTNKVSVVIQNEFSSNIGEV